MEVRGIGALDPKIAAQKMTHMTIEGGAALESFLAERIPEYKAVHASRGVHGPEITIEELRKLHPDRFDKKGQLTQTGEAWAYLATLAVMGKIAKGPRLPDVTIGEFADTYVRRQGEAVKFAKFDKVANINARLQASERLSDPNERSFAVRVFNWVAKKVNKSVRI